MKKILVLLFLVLLTTGCQASYDIEIGDYNIKEKITINVPNNLDNNSKATIIILLTIIYEKASNFNGCCLRSSPYCVRD